MANPEHVEILKQGVEVWNKWREQNPDIKPDLKEADLSGTDIRGINLREADLQGADLLDIKLGGTMQPVEDLILLSTYKTCEYKNIDFWQFLLSGETVFDTFEARNRRR